MKTQSILTALMAMALMFTGCAGKSVNPAPIAPKDPLRTHVPESFHFNVENSETLRYLAEVNLKSLAPDQRLEVIVLRQLMEVSSEKELSAAFDRLWESQKQIRELVNNPCRRSEYLMIPLTEIYYLLSAGPAASWQAETAERIYRETLHSVQPHQLSGYSLHFYTLALLKNGKIDDAEPFLLRLENFTAPYAYLQDLAVAMEYAIAAKKYQLACKFIAALCRTGTRYNLELPDGKICSAIRAIEKAGRLDLAVAALMPQVLGNPDLRKYTFVRLLNKTVENSSSQSHIETTAKDVKPIHTPTPRPESTGHEIKTSSATVQKKILIKVQIISAGNQSNYTDPDLYEIDKDLRETLNFTSFTLIGEEKLRLKTGEKGVLHLTQGHSLTIIPRSIGGSNSRIEVAITKGNRQLLHTLIESVDEGATIIGGPRSEDKAILLRIITFIPKFSGRQAA
jgi:hypothetical protein